MKNKKILSLLLAMVLSLSLLAGCNNTSTANNKEAETTSGSETQTAQNSVDERQEEAEQLLADLTGTYKELWPVILADEYKQIWLDDSAELVGEENAEEAVEKMTSMVTGEIYGEEAVKAYADGGMAYCCEFTQGIAAFEFKNGDTIKGFDKNGKELFSHTYRYIGMENTRELYIYESEDADSEEFTYFCVAPDTSETTYHIEFRYGSDLDDLGKYDAGGYAYWLAAGIATDYDQEMVENVIKLFCTENLSEQ